MLQSEVSAATLAKLRAVGEREQYDIVKFYTYLKGQPIYELDWSTRPPCGKTGWPYLFLVDEQGEIHELDLDGIFAAMSALRRSKNAARNVGHDEQAVNT